MRISNELWSSNLDLAYSSYFSPFVEGIKSGKLPLVKFQEYIAQDAFFLEAFANAYVIAITKCPDKHSVKILSDLLNGVTEELRLHNSYALKWGVNLENTSIHSSTKSYINFLKSIVKTGDMVEIISAMTPCMRLYSWIGQSINRKITRINNPYEDWIITYSDIEFENLANLLESLIDTYFEECQVSTIKSLYTKAMELELMFFKSYSP